MFKQELGYMDKLLVTLNGSIERYWLVMQLGAVIAVSAMLYGYIYDYRELIIWAAYGLIVCVCTLPAFLMSAFLIAKLIASIKIKARFVRSLCRLG